MSATVTTPEHLTYEKIRSVAESESNHFVSFYLPTTRGAVKPEENSLRLKDALRIAAEKLEQRALRRPDTTRLLGPVSRLLDDSDFWLHQLEGLAIFRSESELVHYRLGFDVPELVVAGRSPYVRPLLPALLPGTHFLILAVSQNAVKLFDCSRFEAGEVDLSDTDIPRSLEEALRYDDLQKPELQHHPTTGPGRAPEGQTAPAESPGGRVHGFHGHGESGESQKTQIRRYFQAVDAGLYKLIGPDGPPIVLAGVDYLCALYKEVTDLHSIVDENVEGNPDRLSGAKLHERAIPIVEKRSRARVAETRDAYGRLEPRGAASTDLVHVLEAAHEGRIATLLLERDVLRWGLFNASDRSLEERREPGPTDVDLFELAARQTLLHGGTVLALDREQMVETAQIAAIFRY